MNESEVGSVTEIAPQSGVKHDSGKPRFELLSDIALDLQAQVLTFGARKYAAHNWRKGLEWERVYAAAQRHLSSWHRGQRLDPETGLPHLAHAAVNLMFLLEFEATSTGTDNRYNGGGSGS